MNRTALVWALVTLPALAGCINGTGGETRSLSSSDTPHSASALGDASGFGSLFGLVTDEELNVLSNVRVEALGTGQSTTTDLRGGFHLNQLPEGVRRISFTRTDFEPATQEVRIAQERQTELDVRLALLPNLRPYKEVLPTLEGHYTCALEAVILTGDCMILVENLTQAEDPITSEVDHGFFSVRPGWTDAVVELTWTIGPQNQLDGMHLYVAPAEESNDSNAHHTKYALAEGNLQPLRVLLHQGQLHPTAEKYENGTYAELPTEGGDVIFLVYPRGKLADTMGQVCEPQAPDKCFLGLGIGLDIRFHVYVTIFYNGPAPSDYTAVP